MPEKEAVNNGMKVGAVHFLACGRPVESPVGTAVSLLDGAEVQN